MKKYTTDSKVTHLSDEVDVNEKLGKIIGEKYTIVLNLGDKWGDVLTNLEDEGIQKKVTQTKNTYIGIKPAEPFTLYSMKFPDEV